MLHTCEKCNADMTQNHCANCEEPTNLKRIDGQYMLDEISSVINFNKGIFFTISELLLRPGKTVRSYLQKDRSRLVKPIVFVIVCSFFYSIIQQILHFEDGYVGYSLEKESTITSIFNWVSENYGYSNLIMGIFIAFWIKIFFRKYKFNFYEILILLCYVMGLGMLIFAIFGIIDSLFDLKIMDKGYFIGVIFILWAIVNFFDSKKFINYPKAIFSYSLGMIMFMLGIYLIGGIIDWLR